MAAYEAPDVRLLALPRQGKNVTLNEAAAAARGDVLVFSDADTMLTPDSLRHLVRAFADPEVGGVAGERRHAEHVGTGTIHRVVWRLKRGIRELLSRAGSVTAAEGQVHAVRRELFTRIPDNVLDDLWISVHIVAAHRRLVYEPLAGAYPFAGATALRTPFDRKRRLTRYWLRASGRPAGCSIRWSTAFFPFSSSPTSCCAAPLHPAVGLAGSAPRLGAAGGYTISPSSARLDCTARSRRLPSPGDPLGLWAGAGRFAFDMVHVASLAALLDLLRGRRERDDIWVPQRAAVPEAASDPERGGAP